MEYQILKPGDSDYPARLKERLGRDAPVLYARGPLSLLSRWTLCFLTADVEPGGVTRAVWDMFFPVLEYEMNAIGAWQAVNEGVFFRSALEKPWISLTLFTAKGIERETYETFVESRHPVPQDYFLQKPEYERRAKAGELLLLSIAPASESRQLRQLILRRNWIACHLADAVFIGGAERVSKQWSTRANRLVGRRQKTYQLAKRLARSGVPVFTVDHPDNRDLLDLGIAGQKPDTVGAFIERMGARKGTPPAAIVGAPATENASRPVLSEPRKNARQLELFKATRRTSSPKRGRSN